ncbi:MAG TPA: type II toxin-antitoxin system VapC family toxin [Terriglobia bacterium]|nr:type II toxin-antitoxin system VapC family toxin [Terriglobia bacterium]
MISLDASALLAFLLRERGHERVRELLSEACMSTVNFSEVLGRFARAGQDVVLIAEKLVASPIELVPFSTEQAAIAAALLPVTQSEGLSLGDRACLALAREREIRAVTADQSWRRLKIRIEIEIIR